MTMFNSSFEQCAICFEKYDEINSSVINWNTYATTILICGHKYHSKCMNEFINTQSENLIDFKDIKCPYCNCNIYLPQLNHENVKDFICEGELFMKMIKACNHIDNKTIFEIFKLASYYDDTTLSNNCLLAIEKCDINCKDNHNYNLLHHALDCEHSDEIIIALINKGVNLNAKTKYGDQPIHIALVNEDSYNDIIFTMLNHNIEFDTPNGDGYTPLALSIKNSNPVMTNKLIQMGAKINHTIIILYIAYNTESDVQTFLKRRKVNLKIRKIFGLNEITISHINTKKITELSARIKYSINEILNFRGFTLNK